MPPRLLVQLLRRELTPLLLYLLPLLLRLQLRRLPLLLRLRLLLNLNP